MTNEPKFNAEQICDQAILEITRHMVPASDTCTVIRDESGAYFVFELTNNCFGEKKSERLTVLAAMIEDGIISNQQLLAALWHTLGKLRGMA
jgi:hypothetical protein